MYFLLLLCYYLVVVKIDQLPNGYIGMLSLFPTNNNVKRNMSLCLGMLYTALHKGADTIIVVKLMIQLVISKQWGETPMYKFCFSIV